MGPSTDEVRQAFARFAKAAVTKVKGYQPMWEIWNEPNNLDFWRPHPDAAAYMQLVQLTSEAIRLADAHAPIVAPAVVTFPQQDPNAWSFLEQCFGLGLLQQVDAVSIHPYRSQVPETVTQDYQRLRTLMAHYAPAEKVPLPIYSSEWGYPVIGPFSQSDQAAFFVREVLTNVLNGLPLSIWYDWQDDGPDPQNLQDNFGLLSWDGKPKLAYLAAKTLTKQLGAFHFVQRLPLSSSEDYALLFVHQVDRTLVLWTTADPHAITLPVTAPSATVISITGEMRELTTTQGTVTIELTGSPQYVRLST
jgi:beta-xylosidase